MSHNWKLANSGCLFSFSSISEKVYGFTETESLLAMAVATTVTFVQLFPTYIIFCILPAARSKSDEDMGNLKKSTFLCVLGPKSCRWTGRNCNWEKMWRKMADVLCKLWIRDTSRSLQQPLLKFISAPQMWWVIWGGTGCTDTNMAKIQSS